MKAEDIGQWMREEHAKVEELADRLRERVGVVPRLNLERWLREVRHQFEHFRAHMVRHMALEEHNGYMSAVVERRPTLSPQVDRLNHEHLELSRLLETIHAALGQIGPDDRLLVRDCCRRIGELLNYIEHHENDENMLVTFVFTQDIGTKD